MDTISKPARGTAFLVILALVPATTGFAQAGKGQRGGARPAASSPKSHGAGPSQHVCILHHGNANCENLSGEAALASLRSTVNLLNQLDQDYNGHKPRAIRELNAAIKFLSPVQAELASGPANSQGPAIAGRARAEVDARTRPSPATSDARLGEAQKALIAIELQMDVGGVNPHQFTLAKASVENAIREVNLALYDR